MRCCKKGISQCAKLSSEGEAQPPRTTNISKSLRDSLQKHLAKKQQEDLTKDAM